MSSPSPSPSPSSSLSSSSSDSLSPFPLPPPPSFESDGFLSSFSPSLPLFYDHLPFLYSTLTGQSSPAPPPPSPTNEINKCLESIHLFIMKSHRDGYKKGELNDFIHFQSYSLRIAVATIQQQIISSASSPPSPSPSDRLNLTFPFRLLQTIFNGNSSTSKIYKDYGHEKPSNAVCIGGGGGGGGKKGANKGDGANMKYLYKGQFAQSDSFTKSSVSTLLIDHINEFGSIGGFDILLNYIEKEKSIGEINQIVKILSLISPYLIPSYFEPYFHSILTSLFTSNILKSFTESQLKQLSNSDIEILLSLCKKISSSQSNKIELLNETELFEIQLTQRLIESPALEKRLQGINMLINIINTINLDNQREEKGRYYITLNNTFLTQWIVDNNLLNYLLGNSSTHTEIIKRMDSIIEYCFLIANIIEEKEMEMVVELLNIHHEYTCSILFSLFLNMTEYLPINYLIHLYQLIITKLDPLIQSHSLQLSHINFIHQYTYKSIKNRKKNTNRPLDIQEENYLFGLDLLWDLINNNEERGGKGNNSLVMAAFKSIIQLNMLGKERQFYFIKCIDNIKENRFSTQSVAILETILIAIKENEKKGGGVIRGGGESKKEEEWTNVKGKKNKISSSTQSLSSPSPSPSSPPSVAQYLQNLDKAKGLINILIDDLIRYSRSLSQPFPPPSSSSSLTSPSKSLSSSLGQLAVSSPSPSSPSPSLDISGLQLRFRILLLFLSSSSLCLSIDQSSQIWSVCIENPHFHSLLFTFFRDILPPPSSSSVPCYIEEKAIIHLFDKLICSSPTEQYLLSFSKEKYSLFSLFIDYFFYLNCLTTHISSHISPVQFTVNSLELWGLDKLWMLSTSPLSPSTSTALLSENNTKGIETIIDLLVSVYMNLNVKQFVNKGENERMQIVGKCFDSIGQAADPSVILRCLLIIKRIIMGNKPLSKGHSPSSSSPSKENNTNKSTAPEQIEINLCLTKESLNKIYLYERSGGGNIINNSASPKKYTEKFPSSTTLKEMREIASLQFEYPPLFLDFIYNDKQYNNNQLTLDEIRTSNQLAVMTINIKKRIVPTSLNEYIYQSITHHRLINGYYSSSPISILIGKEIKYYSILFSLLSPSHHHLIQNLSSNLLSTLPINQSRVDSIIFRSIPPPPADHSPSSPSPSPPLPPPEIWAGIFNDSSPLQLINKLELFIPLISSNIFDPLLLCNSRIEWANDFIESNGFFTFFRAFVLSLPQYSMVNASNNNGLNVNINTINYSYHSSANRALNLLIDIIKEFQMNYNEQDKINNIIFYHFDIISFGNGLFNLIENNLFNLLSINNRETDVNERENFDLFISSSSSLLEKTVLLLIDLFKYSCIRNINIVPLWIRLCNINFIAFLSTSLLSIQHNDVRQAIYSSILHITSELNQFTAANPSLPSLFLHISDYLLSMLPNISIQNNHSAEYFSLLKSLFVRANTLFPSFNTHNDRDGGGEKGKVEESNNNNPLLMNGKGENMVQTLYLMLSHFPSSSSSINERLLINLLSFLSLLYSTAPHLKDMRGMEMVQLLYNIYLFNINQDKCVDLSVCTKSNTRSIVYDSLLSLTENNINNSATLLYLISFNHFDMRTNEQGQWDWDPVSNNKYLSNHNQVALFNYGCTCFQISLLQQLYHTPSIFPSLINVISTHPTEGDLIFELQKLFINLKYSYKKYYSPYSFSHTFLGYDGLPLPTNVQMDVTEFGNILFERLEQIMTSGGGGAGGGNEEKIGDEEQVNQNSINNIIKQLFQGKINNELIYLPCGHSSDRPEPFYFFPIDINQHSSLLSALGESVKGEILGTDNKVHCDQCGEKREAEKRAIISHLPQILVIQLKRFEFDYETYRRKKLNGYCEFPLLLNMSPYTMKEEGREEEGGEGEGEDMYELVGILVHSGHAESGHYYSYIKQRGGGEEVKEGETEEEVSNRWFEYNDTNITPFSADLIPLECYGGTEMIPAEKGGKGEQKEEDIEIEKGRSAYLLFYEKIKKKEEIIELNKEIIDEKEKNFNNSLSFPSLSPSSLPSYLENEILQITSTNISLIRDLNVFNINYSNFLFSLFSKIIEFIPSNQIYPTNNEQYKYCALPSPFPASPSFAPFPLVATAALSHYVFNIYIHSRSLHKLEGFLALLQSYFMKDINCLLWFIDRILHEIDIDYNWIKQCLVDCPNQNMKKTMVNYYLFLLNYLISYEIDEKYNKNKNIKKYLFIKNNEENAASSSSPPPSNVPRSNIPGEVHMSLFPQGTLVKLPKAMQFVTKNSPLKYIGGIGENVKYLVNEGKIETIEQLALLSDSKKKIFTNINKKSKQPILEEKMINNYIHLAKNIMNIIEENSKNNSRNEGDLIDNNVGMFVGLNNNSRLVQFIHICLNLLQNIFREEGEGEGQEEEKTKEEKEREKKEQVKKEQLASPLIDLLTQFYHLSPNCSIIFMEGGGTEGTGLKF